MHCFKENITEFEYSETKNKTSKQAFNDVVSLKC